MKKVLRITIEVDDNSPQAEEWKNKSDFVECLIDDTLDHIRGHSATGQRFYRNCSGRTDDGAKYKVHVKHIRSTQTVIWEQE